MIDIKINLCLGWPSATLRWVAILFIIVLPVGALLEFGRYYLTIIRSFPMLLSQYLPSQ